MDGRGRILGISLVAGLILGSATVAALYLSPPEPAAPPPDAPPEAEPAPSWSGDLLPSAHEESAEAAGSTLAERAPPPPKPRAPPPAPPAPRAPAPRPPAPIPQPEGSQDGDDQAEGEAPLDLPAEAPGLPETGLLDALTEDVPLQPEGALDAAIERALGVEDALMESAADDPPAALPSLALAPRMPTIALPGLS